MFSPLLNAELREDSLNACYFFYGEEMFLAQQFIRDLKKTLITPDAQNISAERFILEETPWREILDVALKSGNPPDPFIQLGKWECG